MSIFPESKGKPENPGGQGKGKGKGKAHGKHKVGVCRFIPGEGSFRYEELPPPSASNAIRKGGFFASSPEECGPATEAVIGVEEDEEA